MSSRLIFIVPDFHFPIHGPGLANLEYRIPPINLPISKSTESLIRSRHKLNIFYSKLLRGNNRPNRLSVKTTQIPSSFMTPTMGRVEPQLNRFCNLGEVELESFPARTLPFSFLGPNYPNPDSRISSNEVRSPMGRVALGQVNKEGRVEPQLNGSRTQGRFEPDSNQARIPLNHPKLMFFNPFFNLEYRLTSYRSPSPIT
jgi:hypothetical protein